MGKPPSGSIVEGRPRAASDRLLSRPVVAPRITDARSTSPGAARPGVGPVARRAVRESEPDRLPTGRHAGPGGRAVEPAAGQPVRPGGGIDRGPVVPVGRLGGVSRPPGGGHRHRSPLPAPGSTRATASARRLRARLDCGRGAAATIPPSPRSQSTCWRRRLCRSARGRASGGAVRAAGYALDPGVGRFDGTGPLQRCLDSLARTRARFAPPRVAVEAPAVAIAFKSSKGPDRWCRDGAGIAAGKLRDRPGFQR